MTEARAVAFYDRIADDYDRRMAGPADAWARAAFWELVDARVPPRSTLLDFGCGTGVDAQRYAERGHRVLAYDTSSRMIDVLTRRCSAEIVRGAVDAWSSPYEQLGAALAARGPVDVVTANFAAVNHLPDLDGWLSVMGRSMVAGGKILISSVSACPPYRLRTGAFWKAVATGVSRRGIVQPGEAGDTMMYWPWALGRESAAFRVASRWGVGGLVGEGKRPLLGRVERAIRGTPPGWLLGRYTFVELVKL